jgi:hypothetical protein
MNQFLEELKSRMEDAQRRLQLAAAALQAAQVQHQAIAQEFGSLQFLFQVETRKAQGGAAHAASVPQQAAIRAQVTPIQSPPADQTEPNKTELVRDVLRQHPDGMQPKDLWKAVSGQIGHRPYLYSILKRLRERGDVFQKRGKYFPKMTPKPEDGKEQLMLQ